MRTDGIALHYQDRQGESVKATVGPLNVVAEIEQGLLLDVRRCDRIVVAGEGFYPYQLARSLLLKADGDGGIRRSVG